VQVERLNAGEMVNDEHIFNFLINSNNSIKNTAGIMQKDQFVIGHRFFSVLLTRAFKNMKAFHVNYVRGEKYKLRRMKILSRRSRMRQLFSIFLLLEFARKGREITSRQLRS
jgi:hypothetical protein